MQALKNYTKHLFFKTGLSSLFDLLLFKLQYYKNRSKNQAYVNQNIDVAFPSDYYLYETYQLDYRQYIEDGDLSAKEIVEWTLKYISKDEINLLEWGCGVSRTTRHLHKYLPVNSNIFGCDVNTEMIKWNQENIEKIKFSAINYNPPTHYKPSFFDIVFCISVLTHIDSSEQENWLKEIHRILSDDSIFLFTTHGSFYQKRLLLSELRELNYRGVFTKLYTKKGHRLMSTYNKSDEFKNLVNKYFQILEFYDGENNIKKVGGQDLWIVRKRK